MKKILLAAGVLLTVAANAQDNKSMNKSTTGVQQSGAKQDVSLDGKAFKITLNDNSSGTSDSHNAGGMNQEAGQNGNVNSSNSNKMDDKKMMLYFSNGLVRTTGKNDIKVKDCSYTTNGSLASGITFTANCSPMTGMNNRSAEGRTGSNDAGSTGGAKVTDEYRTNTGTTRATTGSSTGNPSTGNGSVENGSTAVNPDSDKPGWNTGTGSDGNNNTGANTSGNSSQTGTSANGSSNSGNNQNGTGTSTGNTGRNTGINGSSSGSVNGSTASDNSGINDNKNIMISGTITGNAISGTIMCTKSDGTRKKYTYTGMLADQKDLDAEKEMGLNK